MKTCGQRRALHVLGLIVSLIVWCAGIASAQQSLEVPPPSSQSAPSVRFRPKPTPRPAPSPAEVQTIPPAAQPARVAPEPVPTPPSAHQPEPMLPALFRGCWEGEVSRLDSIERVPGGAKIGPWTPKTYRLCYRRVGDGPFELTFTEAGIARSRRITNAKGRMRVLTSDGRTYATMRAFLHFDEYRTHSSYFGGSTFPVDEVTKIEADIEPDGMHVWGQVAGNHSGNPWFRAWWHTVFIHVPEPPEPSVPDNGVPE